MLRNEGIERSSKQRYSHISLHWQQIGIGTLDISRHPEKHEKAGQGKETAINAGLICGPNAKDHSMWRTTEMAKEAQGDSRFSED